VKRKRNFYTGGYLRKWLRQADARQVYDLPAIALLISKRSPTWRS